DDDGAIDRTATVALTGVTNPTGQTGDNPREKAVFSFVDANTVSYNEHAWGVDVFNFDVTYSEPRGFAAAPITYTLPASQDITVTATPDPTVLATNTFTGFSGAEFVGATDARTITRTATATFTDPDLAYDDDIAAVLGELTVSTSAGELVFSPPTYTLTQGAADDQATLTGVSYSLSLTGAAAVAKDTTEYPIVFNFVEGTDLSGADAVTITFAPQAANPTIVAGDAAFLTDLTGTATVVEGAALNALVGTLTIADADLTKANPGTFTYTIPTNPRNLVKWETIDPITDTASSGQRANRLVLAKALDDADVGVHTITWTMVDNLADGAGTLTGTLTLTVTRVDDDAVATPGADIVSFNTPTSLALNRNSNAGATKTFPITLRFDDPDFLEDPVATLESVTYGQVAFSFTYPTIVSGGPQVCRITPTGGSLLAGADSQAPAGVSITRTGNLARAADTAITFANIQAASTNCRNIPVGSTLTSVQLSGVTVDTDSGSDVGATTFSTFSTTPPAYVIQGYRERSHTVAAPALSVPPGGAETLTVTITDGDPDDGVAHNPTNSNVVRTSPGSAWAPVTVDPDSECSSRILLTPAPAGGYVYTAGSNAAESTVSIIVAGMPGASGSCVLTIRSAGEDGQSISVTSTVTVQPAPSLSTLPAFTPSSITDANAFDYASDTVALNAQVRSTDAGDTNPINITVIPNDFCSIPNNQQNPTAAAGVGLTDYPITATVTPLKPGPCTVTVTATEDGAAQSRPASITFPELAPNFTATSLTSVARSDISSSILTGGKTFASPNRDLANNGAFAMALTATNRDLGDDAARSDQARFEITSGASGLCTAQLSSLAEDYSSTTTIGGTATTTLTITPTSTTGGICQAITITATEGDSGEAGATSNGVITIPQGTFVFDSVSTVHAPTVVNAFTDYTTPITYTATATSNDGSIDDSTIVPQSNTEAICSIVTPVDTGTVSGLTSSSTITITPVTPGLCSIRVAVSEDGN
ncbi:MAG: hypothetical protein K0U41_07355, partial [Gammaproteobacteria bacterium]|nr:hypothetical protein [Gammaproteobacteria bacterium]